MLTNLLPRLSTILDFRSILLFIASIGYLFSIQDFFNGPFMRLGHLFFLFETPRLSLAWWQVIGWIDRVAIFSDFKM